MTERPIVSVSRCVDYAPEAVSASVREALRPLGGMRAFVAPGDSVLLKPNMLLRAAPERAVTTHPEVVRAVIREVKAAGGMPTVADSPGGPHTQQTASLVFRGTGIAAVCADEGVPCVLLDEAVTRVPNPRGELYGAFTLGKAVAEADVVITLPKLKTHGFMMFTGAVKNLFGCVPGLEKTQYHLKVPAREDFADMLLDLMLACRPTLAVMDAVVGMEGRGPAGGTPRHIGAIMASADCVALDVVASATIGLDPLEVYTNRAAAARGLGPADVDGVRIAGSDWRSLAPQDFALPARDVSAGMPQWMRERVRGAATARPALARPADCTRCGECERECPVGAVRMEDGGLAFDDRTCIRCYCCQELCPAQAIGLRRPLLARLADPRRGRE